MNQLDYSLIFICTVMFTQVIGAQEPTRQNSKIELTRQLEDARARLEQTAREIAELSGQLGGDQTFAYFDLNHFGRHRAILGINIGGARDDGKSDGVEILAVTPDSPADQAGLKAGDVLLSIDSESLAGASSNESSEKLLRRMEKIEPGTPVSVEFTRKGKTTKADIQTTALSAMKFRKFFVPFAGDDFHAPGPGMHIKDLPSIVENNFSTLFWFPRQWGNLELVGLTPSLGKYFGTKEGVLVVSAPDDETLKLEDGDVILSIDGRKPNDPNHALGILRSYAPGESLTIKIMRDKHNRILEITVPETGGDKNAFNKAPLDIERVHSFMPPNRPNRVFIHKSEDSGFNL